MINIIDKEDYLNAGHDKDNKPEMYADIIMKDNQFWCENLNKSIVYWYNPKTEKWSWEGISKIKCLIQIISNKENRGVKIRHANRVIRLIKERCCDPEKKKFILSLLE